MRPSVDESFYDPRFDRVLTKLSTTIDKTDFRNAEADAREQFNLEWKQVRHIKPSKISNECSTD